MFNWFDPKITIGNVIAVVVAAGALVAGYISLNNTVQMDTATISKIADTVEKLADRTTKVETKLDMMIQFGGGGGH